VPSSVARTRGYSSLIDKVRGWRHSLVLLNKVRIDINIITNCSTEFPQYFVDFYWSGVGQCRGIGFGYCHDQALYWSIITFGHRISHSCYLIFLLICVSVLILGQQQELEPQIQNEDFLSRPGLTRHCAWLLLQTTSIILRTCQNNLTRRPFIWQYRCFGCKACLQMRNNVYNS
jgi:hypothetical protein